ARLRAGVVADEDPDDVVLVLHQVGQPAMLLAADVLLAEGRPDLLFRVAAPCMDLVRGVAPRAECLDGPAVVVSSGVDDRRLHASNHLLFRCCGHAASLSAFASASSSAANHLVVALRNSAAVNVVIVFPRIIMIPGSPLESIAGAYLMQRTMPWFFSRLFGRSTKNGLLYIRRRPSLCSRHRLVLRSPTGERIGAHRPGRRVPAKGWTESVR